MLSPSRPTRAKRYGCETPRIYTKPVRALTPETSLGFSVIEFAEQVLHVELMPWQRWLLVHMLELLPDNSLRFRTVVVLVARQNGKSTLSKVVALWFMYVYGVAMVIGTAQDLDVAEEIWQDVVDLVMETDDEDEPVRPELHELVEKVVQVNGKKSLNLTTKQRYKIKAANRRAGRGLSGDVILLDELREHQNWHAWGAITKTTMARSMALILALSNAGDATSVVLHHLRRMGIVALIAGGEDALRDELKELGELLAGEVDDDQAAEADEDDGDPLAEDGADSVALFEWSAPPGCSKWDRDGWAQANPAMGYRISERTIAEAAATDPEEIFRTEVLCQWVESVTDTAIDIARWGALLDTKPERGVPVFAIATSPNREWCCISTAWRRPDGLVQVMIGDDYRPTTTWVPARIAELRETYSGARIIAADQASRGLVEDADELSSGDQAIAHNALHDSVLAQTIRHGNEAAVNTAVRGSRWKLTAGGTRVLEPNGSIDISPLRAAAAAAHAAAAGTQFRSAYEDSDLRVV